MLHRLIANWVYGGFLAGLLLLVLTSTLTHSWPAALTATYLCLPIYMLHQYEEHDDDRFRQFFNGIVGNGRRGLSLGAVFLINVPAVWGAIGISLALAASVNIGFGLIAVYLLLINALVHIAHAIAYRGYNPGLGTAIALFLPVGGYGVYAIQRAGGGSVGMHLTGFVFALASHAAIVVHAMTKTKAA